MTTFVRANWSDSEKSMIRKIACPEVDDLHFQHFLYMASRLGLDPLARQIYCITRQERAKDGSYRKIFQIQSSIDGLRLVADRTGRYMPSDEIQEVYKGDQLHKTTVYVKKMDANGNWHRVIGTAYLSEFVQLKNDNKPTKMWASKTHVMLAKCAEALALRKAFPGELSGIYTDEEMGQRLNKETAELLEAEKAEVKTLDAEQVAQLEGALAERPDIQERILKHCGVDDLEKIPQTSFATVMRGVTTILQKEVKQSIEGAKSVQ